MTIHPVYMRLSGLCLYANAFLKGIDRESLVIPDPPPGIFASLDHTVHLQFNDKFEEQDGRFLTFHDGHCLCQYSDWKTLTSYANSIREANTLEVIPLMLFGTGVEYENLDWHDFYPKLDEMTERPKQGTIFNIRIIIVRRLLANIGKKVELRYKSGKIARGILERYEDTEDYGILHSKEEDVFFSFRELENVVSMKE